MVNADAIFAMQGASLDALGSAIEKAIVGLGMGTGFAVALGLVVLGVEALRRRPWRRRRARSRSGPGGTRRREVLR